MSQFFVYRVENSKTRRQFLKVPAAIFGKQHFARLSMQEVAHLAGFESLSYFQKAVQHDAFVAIRNGHCIGRIAGNIHPEQAQGHPSVAAFFGLYESIDDLEVSQSLFEAAADWARQHSATSLIGPFSPSVNYYSGLRVNEFAQIPTYFTTWHPPYYEKQLQEFGFQLKRDMLAYRTSLAEIPELDPRISRLIDEASEKINLRVRFAHADSLREDLRSVMDAYNVGLRSMWGYLPMTESEIQDVIQWWVHTVTPEGIVLAEVDGKVVGGVLGLVDLNPQLVSPFNRLLHRCLGSRFLRLRRKHLKMIRMVATFVEPGFVRWGVGPAMLRHYLKHWTEFGLSELEFSWIYENNLYSRKPLEKWGLKPVVTHRVYQKDIQDST